MGEADALDALQVLDGHGNSVQRSQRFARQDRRLRFPRLVQRQIVRHRNEGAETVVVPFDPLQRGLHQLHRRQLLGRDEFPEPIEGLIRQFVVHCHPAIPLFPLPMMQLEARPPEPDRRVHYPMAAPPSTQMVCPVMLRASSEARKAAR